MRLVLDVWVDGRPATKGSLDIGPAGQPLPANKGMKTWSNLVTAAAARDLRGQGVPAGAGVLVAVVYFLSAPRAVRADPGAWYEDPAVASRCGDLDKLERCVNDALTEARVWRDDVQVTMAAPQKYWAGPDIGSGAHVRVWQLEQRDHAAFRRCAVEAAQETIRAAGGALPGDGYPPGG